MPSAAPRPVESKGWKGLYVAALLEGDQERIPQRIAEAERAIVQRVRELFHASGNHLQEEQDIDDALYALRALRTCLAVHGSLAETG